MAQSRPAGPANLTGRAGPRPCLAWPVSPTRPTRGRAWYGPCGLSLSSNSQFTPQNPLKLRSRPSPPTRFLFLPILCSKSTGSPSPPFLPWVLDWTNAVKERGMRKHRALYTPDDWRIHRSSSRHLRHLLSSLSSRVIPSLIPPVFSFIAVAAALALYNSAARLPPLAPRLLPPSLGLVAALPTDGPGPSAAAHLQDGSVLLEIRRGVEGVPCRPMWDEGEDDAGGEAGEEVAAGAAVDAPVVGGVEGAALAHAVLLDGIGPVGDPREEGWGGGAGGLGAEDGEEEESGGRRRTGAEFEWVLGSTGPAWLFSLTGHVLCRADFFP